jgi:1-acyl-sn-glycerol-3-phosphate acyltransferase
MDDPLQKILLSAGEYHTPPDTPRCTGDRLFLGTRFYFMGRFTGMAFSTKRAALEGRYDTRYWVSSSLEVVRLIESCGGRFHITGLDNIRQTPGPVVFLSNHMSTLENMVFPGIIQPLKSITFVVKRELVNHWIFGPVMRSREPIALSRSNPRADFALLMEQGLELLSRGQSMVIFPQSTRRVDFIPEEFNTIGIKLAARAGVPVIPVAIKTDFWEHGRFTKYLGSIHRRRPVYIKFGEPIPVKGNGKEEHQKVLDFIAGNLEKWKSEAGSQKTEGSRKPELEVRRRKLEVRRKSERRSTKFKNIFKWGITFGI